MSTSHPFAPARFFDLTGCRHAALFQGVEAVWEVVPKIAAYIRAHLAARRAAGEALDDLDRLRARYPGAHFDGDDIFVAPAVTIDPTAYIQGPALIEAGSTIRHGALLRGGAIVCGAIVGHASEVKNAALLAGAGAPHFAYIGDSLLGRGVNLGAGSKLSNFPFVSGDAPAPIRFTHDGVVYDTGLTKLGAILGDGAQLGCNCVTNPGCLVGPRTLVYAGVVLPKGYVPPDRVVKLRQPVEIVAREAR